MNGKLFFHMFLYATLIINSIFLDNVLIVEVNAQTNDDIHPVSRNRLPPVNREDLDDFGKEIYDSYIEEGLSFDEVLGPRGIRIHSPRVAEYMTKGNRYLRYGSGIDPKLRELTILIAAREMDNAYEWTAHENTAREVGLDERIIEIIKQSRPIPNDLGREEEAILKLGREVLQNHKVTSDTYAQALNIFGRKKLVDIVSLLAHYTATAIVLTTFDQRLPVGEDSLLEE
jgi:4-carboxymuconolactone decarboxylase